MQNARGLKWLYANDNTLNNVPSGIGTLPELEVLALSNNKNLILSAAFFQSETNLKTVYLDKEVPDSIVFPLLQNNAVEVLQY